MMTSLLGLLLLSFIITSFFMVPFIDLLFYLRRKYKKPIPKGYNSSTTPIHNKLLAGKDIDTPVGGGILLIFMVVVLSIGFAYFSGLEQPTELYIILFTFLSFGFIGLLDDVNKIFTAFNGK